MRLLIGALLVGGSLAFLVWSLGREVSVYSDFRTASQNPHESYHIVAKWIEREQSYYDALQDLFHFRAQDTLGNISWVIYPDPKPLNLESAQRIVLIGKYQDSVFYAEKILLKCPSKYKEEGVRGS